MDMKPEDEYVADFVKGISRLEVVKANSIMKPIDEFNRDYGPISDDAIRVKESDVLSGLIEKLVSSKKPVVIIDSKGQDIGAISQRDLLVSIVEGRDE